MHDLAGEGEEKDGEIPFQSLFSANSVRFPRKRKTTGLHTYNKFGRRDGIVVSRSDVGEGRRAHRTEPASWHGLCTAIQTFPFNFRVGSPIIYYITQLTLWLHHIN